MYSILVVDDESLIRKGIVNLIDFKALSINEVYEASDGEEALEIVIKMRPNIVLADINMPKMDGLALAKAIKAKYQETIIVIITGYDYFEYAQTALKTGVDDYILKPVSKNDISELLKRLTDKLKNQNNNKIIAETVNKIDASSNIGLNTDQNYKEEIIKIINDKFSDAEFSLLVLAKKINLSNGYLSNLFKTLFGIPFQDYLINLRLERSKILLLSTGYKIYEVAEKVGFEDPNYFSLSFKKKYGISPNSFRDNKEGGK